MTKKNNAAKKKTENTQEAPDFQALLEEKEEALLRALADVQNIRRRHQEDRIQLPQIGTEKIVLALLPTLDHLNLAMQNIPEEKTDWIQGIEAISSQLSSALQQEGLEKIDQKDVPINPEIHEVLAIDEKAKEGMVGEILQQGYALKGKTLRTAKVKGGTQKA